MTVRLDKQLTFRLNSVSLKWHSDSKNIVLLNYYNGSRKNEILILVMFHVLHFSLQAVETLPVISHVNCDFYGH